MFVKPGSGSCDTVRARLVGKQSWQRFGLALANTGSSTGQVPTFDVTPAVPMFKDGGEATECQKTRLAPQRFRSCCITRPDPLEKTLFNHYSPWTLCLRHWTPFVSSSAEDVHLGRHSEENFAAHQDTLRKQPVFVLSIMVGLVQQLFE